MAPLPEKVLSLGDIVSLTFRRFRLYYKLYFKTLFWPAFFCSLASHIAYLSLQHWVSIAATSLLAATPFILHMGCLATLNGGLVLQRLGALFALLCACADRALS
jgi:hypothetical protein